VKVTGAHNTRISLAALICTKSGHTSNGRWPTWPNATSPSWPR
jgi:hypothetical protein